MIYETYKKHCDSDAVGVIAKEMGRDGQSGAEMGRGKEIGRGTQK